MPTTYDRQFKRGAKRTPAAGSTLIAMQRARVDGQTGNLEGLSLDGAHQAEATGPAKLRHLIYRSGQVSRREYLAGALPSTEVRFSFTRDSALLILPPLLPDRRSAKSGNICPALSMPRWRRPPLPTHCHNLTAVFCASCIAWPRVPAAVPPRTMTTSS